MPDKTGETRDSIVAKFAVVSRDYGRGGIRVELSQVGIMPLWVENNHLGLKNGREKTPFIHPLFIDRELPRLQARLDDLSRETAPLSAEAKAGMDTTVCASGDAEASPGTAFGADRGRLCGCAAESMIDGESPKRLHKKYFFQATINFFDNRYYKLE